ncbi:hypothetical protein [Ruania zhangjianzhongii]|uniref:hypothetical protein n=1 Tax=Ruania zhangjianzhongii TaxID=2603206 RepID=UPI0011C7F96E|nr:hypothetical protein [Ruania zhangjianzhongii]
MAIGPIGPPPQVPLAEIGRSVRLLSAWGAGVGGGLLVLLAFVGISSYAVFGTGDQRSDPSDGSMFAGGEEFFAWLIGNLAAGFGIFVLGVTALVLDITVLAKLSRLRRYGVRTEMTRPLTVALVLGMGLVSTPAGLLLLLIPSMVFGPGQATDTALIVIVLLMLAVPVTGRIAQVNCARRLVGLLSGQHAGWTPAARPGSW